MKTPLVPRKFANRRDAGQQLAAVLSKFAGTENLVVLALPRGGVPVAAEIARSLGKPLDVMIVRKLGVPWHEELALGAIASGGILVLSRDLIARLRMDQLEIDAIIQRETSELDRREKLYRQGRTMPAIGGQTVIVVDDGIATGSTMLAAVKLLRCQQAHRVIVAVPVAPGETTRLLRGQADEVIALHEPEPFGSVGEWYDDFSQTGDDEVRELLAKASLPENLD